MIIKTMIGIDNEFNVVYRCKIAQIDGLMIVHFHQTGNSWTTTFNCMEAMYNYVKELMPTVTHQYVVMV